MALGPDSTWEPMEPTADVATNSTDARSALSNCLVIAYLLSIFVGVMLAIVAARAEETNHYDREAMAQALQAWKQGVGPLPDLIAAQEGLNQAIGPPLTAEELQTVREALWKHEADLIRTDFERGLPNNTIREPTVFQQMAFTHLINGGSLRAGDFTALHGALLTALQPNTNALRLQWEKLMDCVGINKASWCTFKGF